MTAQEHPLAKTSQGERTLNADKEVLEMTGSYNRGTGWGDKE